MHPSHASSWPRPPRLLSSLLPVHRHRLITFPHPTCISNRSDRIMGLRLSSPMPASSRTTLPYAPSRTSHTPVHARRRGLMGWSWPSRCGEVTISASGLITSAPPAVATASMTRRSRFRNEKRAEVPTPIQPLHRRTWRVAPHACMMPPGGSPRNVLLAECAPCVAASSACS